MFGLSGRKGAESDAATSVTLVGEGYRRSYVKHLLGGRARVAELASDRRAHLLAENSDPRS